jgi:hypothetical protein
LSDSEAGVQIIQNRRDIQDSDALLYFPSLVWSPGRLIDYGMALAYGLPIIICGAPENSMYFRSEMVTVCEPVTLTITLLRVLRIP